MLKLATIRRILSLLPATFAVSVVVIAATTTVALAGTMTGKIRNDGPTGSVYLITANQSALAIDARAGLFEFIRHLRTGDQITAQCTLSSDGRRVSIDSVDRVGLQELLGTWRSSRWEIFEFRDFTSLNLYVPAVVDAGSPSLVQTHALKYVITPEQNDRYSIFMSDDLSVRMGFLEISAAKLTLTVTDPKTGQVGNSISLSPLHF